LSSLSHFDKHPALNIVFLACSYPSPSFNRIIFRKITNLSLCWFGIRFSFPSVRIFSRVHLEIRLTKSALRLVHVCGLFARRYKLSVRCPWVFAEFFPLPLRSFEIFDVLAGITVSSLGGRLVCPHSTCLLGLGLATRLDITPLLTSFVRSEDSSFAISEHPIGFLRILPIRYPPLAEFRSLAQVERMWTFLRSHDTRKASGSG
jgi:hypothetical protein